MHLRGCGWRHRMTEKHHGNPYHDKRGRFTFAPGGAGNSSAMEKKHRHHHTPMSQEEVEARAAHAMDQYHQEIARGKSPAEAAAWAANSEAESRGDPAMHQEGGGPGRGLFQWGSNIPALDRRNDFEKEQRMPVDRASADKQRDFRDWELAHTEIPARNHIGAATTTAGKARAIAIYYDRPKDAIHVADDRARIAEAIIRNISKRRIPIQLWGRYGQ
jgi:hypothetical protein